MKFQTINVVLSGLVDILFDRHQDKLAQIESGLKRKISDFQYQLEMDRRKVEAARKEADRKFQEKLDVQKECP